MTSLPAPASLNRPWLPYAALIFGVIALGFSALFVRWANAPGPVVSFIQATFWSHNGAEFIGIHFLMLGSWVWLAVSACFSCRADDDRPTCCHCTPAHPLVGRIAAGWSDNGRVGGPGRYLYCPYQPGKSLDLTLY